jgi:prepilin-type N-terminal cleavage/methylation domain-containing protein
MATRFYGQQGFSLVELMVVTGIIGVLAMVAIPRVLQHRAYAARQACLRNISQIEGAKQTWGLEHGKHMGDLPQDDDLFGPNAYIRAKPACPAGGEYTINALGTDAICSLLEHAP